VSGGEWGHGCAGLRMCRGPVAGRRVREGGGLTVKKPMGRDQTGRRRYVFAWDQRVRYPGRWDGGGEEERGREGETHSISTSSDGQTVRASIRLGTQLVIPAQADHAYGQRGRGVGGRTVWVAGRLGRCRERGTGGSRSLGTGSPKAGAGSGAGG